MYYKELNLPSNPVINFEELIGNKKENAWTYCNNNIDRYISKELLDVFSSVNLRPKLFAWFGLKHKQIAKSTIHSDIGYIDNKWHPLPFGINWELTPSDTTFYWWNTSGFPEILPDENTPKVDVWGIKYNNNKGFYDDTGFTCLDSYKPKLGIPALVRTDIAHQVQYKTDADTRITISIRFDNKDIPTWEDAVKKFEPFFL